MYKGISNNKNTCSFSVKLIKLASCKYRYVSGCYWESVLPQYEANSRVGRYNGSPMEQDSVPCVTCEAVLGSIMKWTSYLRFRPFNVQKFGFKIFVITRVPWTKFKVLEVWKYIAHFGIHFMCSISRKWCADYSVFWIPGVVSLCAKLQFLRLLVSK